MRKTRRIIAEDHVCRWDFQAGAVLYVIFFLLFGQLPLEAKSKPVAPAHLILPSFFCGSPAVRLLSLSSRCPTSSQSGCEAACCNARACEMWRGLACSVFGAVRGRVCSVLELRRDSACLVSAAGRVSAYPASEVRRDRACSACFPPPP